jgi:Tfp pilus assembly protein PilF
MKGMRCVAIALGLIALFGCAAGRKTASVDSAEKARAYYERGVSLSGEKRFKEALSAFKKAVDLYPDYGDAYYNMGIAYHELDRADEAIDAYRKAIDIDPEDVTARNNLGNVFMRQGQMSAAIRELEQAVKIDPTYGLARHNLALAYYLARMYHRAKDQIDELKVLGIAPDPGLVEAVDAALSPGEGPVKKGE